MNNGFYLEEAIDIIEEILASGGTLRIYPRGTSMLPFIVEGRDSVELRAYDREPRKNDIAFYKRDNGQFVLHRIVRTGNDGIYTMCGDNQTALEKGIREDQIIAFAETVYRKNRVINDKNFRYRVYLFFWGIMPFRQVAFFWRRCIGKLARIFKKMFKKTVD